MNLLMTSGKRCLASMPGDILCAQMHDCSLTALFMDVTCCFKVNVMVKTDLLIVKKFILIMCDRQGFSI